MIQPILNANLQAYEKKRKKQPTKVVENSCAYELPKYEVGQAMKAQMGIGFKQNSMPIEVTHLYNKKVEGKDHLDLPNIHVYEYPDTNLQLFVNVDDKVQTSDKIYISERNTVEPPQIIVQIKNNLSFNDYDEIKQILIESIIKTKMEEIAETVVFNIEKTDVQKTFSYSNFLGENVLADQKKLNEIMFNLSFDEKDLNEANLMRVNVESKKITLSDLKEYYSLLKDNISLRVFVTVSSEYFKKNKMDIFNSVNDGICKCQKNSECDGTFIKKEITKNMRHVFDKKLFAQCENNFDNVKNIYKNGYKNVFSEPNFALLKNVELAKLNTHVFNIYEIIDSITEEDVLTINTYRG